MRDTQQNKKHKNSKMLVSTMIEVQMSQSNPQANTLMRLIEKLLLQIQYWGIHTDQQMQNILSTMVKVVIRQETPQTKKFKPQKNHNKKVKTHPKTNH